MLGFKEKLTLKKEALEISKQIKGQGLPFIEKLNLKKRYQEIISLLKKGKTKVSSLIEEYLAGVFSSQPASDFKSTITKVSDEGLDLEGLKKGVGQWLEANGFDTSSDVSMMLESIDAAQLDEEAHKAATSPLNNQPEPSQAQKEAGSYKKGHVAIAGLDISIENPIGSYRRGVAQDGTPWETKMNHHYGDIKRTNGADNDPIDVFLGPNAHNPEMVYVVDQFDPETDVFDEHKVMIGFDSLNEAKSAYLSNYDRGWKGLKTITEVSMNDFKKWLTSGKTDKPFAA